MRCIALLCFCLLMYSSLASSQDKRQVFSIKGDFNGDGKTEVGRVIKPKVSADGSCRGPCLMKIIFSDNKVKPFSDTATGALQLINLGDLDNDGNDEIGLLPDWFSSCWRGYNIYSYKKSKWAPVAGFMTYCEQWSKPIIIKKIKPGMIKVISADFNADHGVVYRNEVIKLGTKKYAPKKHP